MSASRNLSELEGVCLGIIRKRAPCTAYKVREELKEAPSSHWRASAGSVYPLIARLEDDGFVNTESIKGDGRGRTLLRITKAGQAAFRRWLAAGAGQELISSVTDPIRSRTFFLDALGKSQQADYLDKLIRQMERYLEETRERLGDEKDAEDLYDYLGALGATRITEARLEWLQVVRRKLAGA